MLSFLVMTTSDNNFQLKFSFKFGALKTQYFMKSII